ncbi:uncharacterized protein LOC127979146 isoform X1 [Carassius gibelio]|uniref:uncharacterized protein LOC127979146 isoform X1 n=1 Tax=Carassius gibelio TaxID=101364 RepID=UPI002279DD44|nr:uncharacterized protein LOC127979146 isoform X1 [Carassius gibelio]
MSVSPNGDMMFCKQNTGYETIVNDIIALNTNAQPCIASEASGVRPDNTTTPGRKVVVTAQIHAPPQTSTNSAPTDHMRSLANTIPPLSPQAFVDGSSGVGVRRLSITHQEDQDVTALSVQTGGQKPARPRETGVIPNTPERKRPRQSTESEDTAICNEHDVQAWDGCDTTSTSNVDQQKDLNPSPDTVENVADSDGDAEKLSSDQEEYKNRQQNDANKEIWNRLNTVIKNQEIILEQQARFHQINVENQEKILEQQARFYQIIVKNQEQILEEQACFQQIIVKNQADFKQILQKTLKIIIASQIRFQT